MNSARAFRLLLLGPLVALGGCGGRTDWQAANVIPGGVGGDTGSGGGEGLGGASGGYGLGGAGASGGYVGSGGVSSGGVSNGGNVGFGGTPASCGGGLCNACPDCFSSCLCEGGGSECESLCGYGSGGFTASGGFPGTGGFVGAGGVTAAGGFVGTGGFFTGSGGSEGLGVYCPTPNATQTVFCGDVNLNSLPSAPACCLPVGYPPIPPSPCGGDQTALSNIFPVEPGCQDPSGTAAFSDPACTAINIETGQVLNGCCRTDGMCGVDLSAYGLGCQESVIQGVTTQCQVGPMN